MPPTNKKINWRLFITPAFSVMVMLIAVLVIGGWALNVKAHENAFPFWIAMKPNTAFCFFLSALSLLLLYKENHHFIADIFARILNSIVIVIAALIATEHIFNVDFKIDTLVFNDYEYTDPRIIPGRMALATCVNFILLNVSLLLLDNKKFEYWSELPNYIILSSLLISFLEYFFPVNYTYPLAYYFMIAPHTILSFSMLSIGILISRPRAGITKVISENSTTGKSLRRILPFVLLIPIVGIFLIDEGVALKLFEDEFGETLLLASSIIILCVILWFNSKILSHEEMQRIMSEKNLRESEALFRGFAENIHDVFWLATLPDHKVTYVSPAYEKIWGRDTQSLLKNPDEWLLAIHPEDQIKVRAFFYEIMGNVASAAIEYRIIQPDGSLHYIYDRGFQLRDENNNLTGLLGIATDITDYKLATFSGTAQNSIIKILESGNNLQEIAPKILRTISIALDWDYAEIWTVNSKENVLNCIEAWHAANWSNPEFIQICRNKALHINEELPGKIWQSGKSMWIHDLSLHPDFQKIFATNHQFISAFAVPILFNEIVLGVMTFYCHKTREPHNITINMLENVSMQIGEFIQHANVREKLIHSTQKDAVTGLLNRMTLEERIDKKLTAKKILFGIVLIFDVDQFDLIYSNMGLDAGEFLLKSVGHRLEEAMADLPDALVARLTGNRFAVFISHLIKLDDATLFAQKIMNTFKQSFIIQGKEVLSTTSVGISLFPNNGNDSKSLLKNAAIALHRAKESGGNNYQFYSPALPSDLADKLSMEADLRQALLNKEFILQYQPQIDLKTGEICGIEALIRWMHPTKGMIHPDIFIPIVEKTGLITAIGEWALREVCEQISNGWLSHNSIGNLLSVNISNLQFRDSERLLSFIAQLIKELEIDPKSIELEITESALMTDMQRTTAVLNTLRLMGFNLAIDDFGTGFSSLSYLHKLPAKKVKIDKSFIIDLPYDASSASIVKAVIALSHSLGMEVTAEGVEKIEQVEFLMHEGCDAIQGYYFSPPCSLADIKKLALNRTNLYLPKT